MIAGRQWVTAAGQSGGRRCLASGGTAHNHQQSTAVDKALYAIIFPRSKTPAVHSTAADKALV